MIEAVVQTGAFETAYRRAGCGAPVLVLNTADGGLADWLFDELAGRFRAIAPVLPAAVVAGGADAAATLEIWLRGLIDGLGLEQPAIVARGVDAAALLRFAAGDRHRLERLVLLHDGGDGGPTDGWVEGPGSGVFHPVLLLPVPPEDGAGRSEALSELIGFLSADDEAQGAASRIRS